VRIGTLTIKFIKSKERKEVKEMKKTLMVATAMCCILLISGCATRKMLITKTLFSETIAYRLELGAKEYMYKLEKLLQIHQQGEKDSKNVLSDKSILPLYRDADTNKNRIISKKEAKIFYEKCIKNFENALPRTNFEGKNKDVL